MTDTSTLEQCVLIAHLHYQLITLPQSAQIGLTTLDGYSIKIHTHFGPVTQTQLFSWSMEVDVCLGNFHHSCFFGFVA